MKKSSELLPVLRSQLQGDLLALLLLHPEQEYTLSELASEYSVSATAVLREVDRLVKAGILKDRRVGRSRLISTNTDSNLTGPLTELMARTFGPLAVLEDSLAGLPGVTEAYIFGSWAKRYLGEPGAPPHDIDVLVVGNPDPDQLFDRAGEAGRVLHREVNIQRVSREAWQKSHDDTFLRAVKERPMVTLNLSKGTV